MLELRDVRLALGERRFHFNLRLAQGKCLAVIGPSGGGKSTLLALIAGFERPLAGAVFINGQDMTGVPAAKRPVSILFQAHNLFDHLCVAANVGLGIHPGLKLNDQDRAEVAGALGRVGLDGFAGRKPPTLSGGERQRVALARALVRKRPCLLLDEPFAALGPALRLEMLALVNELRADGKLTVVLVSHHPEDARHGAEYTAFVHEGRVLVTGTTAEVFARRRDLPELQSYLGNPP